MATTSRYTVDTRTARRVTVAPGLVMPSPFMVRAEVDGLEADVEVEVVAVPAQADRVGRLVAREVRVRQREGGPPITSDALRAVPVAHLTLVHGAKVAQAVDEGGVTRVSRQRLTAERLAQLREAGPGAEEVLEIVAHVYKLALVMGEAPGVGVADTFNISRRTAGRWIAAARERGHLGAVQVSGRADG